LRGPAVAMAVDLDDQPAVRPVRVDLLALDVGVRQRPRVIDEPQEAELGAALGTLLAALVAGDRVLERAQVAAPVRPRDRGAGRVEAESLAPRRLADHAEDLVRVRRVG